MKTLTQEDLAGLSGSDRDWAYNSVDCLVTSEVQEVLASHLSRELGSERIYQFELACQSPALTMMLRGAAFDERAAAAETKRWLAEVRQEQEAMAPLVAPFWHATERRKGKCSDAKPHAWDNAKNRKLSERSDHPDSVAVCRKCGCSRLVARAFNPLASGQVMALLYECFQLPRQHSRKGDRAVTADDEALMTLAALRVTTPEQVAVIEGILRVRGAMKQVGFLKSKRSADGRLRQSVNVGATETGRWSASKDPFWEGTNFQNIADRSRHVIRADPGLWLLYADLEQAESRIVAFDAECEQDIADHASGDTHTRLCQDLFPDLPWMTAPDREVAQTPLPWDPSHDHRYVAKIVRHGTNIGMRGRSIGREIHQSKARGDELRDRYFSRYPENLRRQREIMMAVRERGVLTTPLRRKRQFFGHIFKLQLQFFNIAGVRDMHFFIHFYNRFFNFFIKLFFCLSCGSYYFVC